MVRSKAWNWKKGKDAFWLNPCMEAHYLAQRWKQLGFTYLLDHGCGLGRHAVFFAEHGFSVKAFDLSEEAVRSVQTWAQQRQLNIEVTQADMLRLPYAENTVDAIIAYNVLSHTDTQGAVQAITEIGRVLRPGGEVFLTLCSKETWSFKDAGFPKVDNNTVIRMDDGPEHGIPHFFVDKEVIFELFSEFDLISVRHIDNWMDVMDQKPKGIHYFILVRKKA